MGQMGYWVDLHALQFDDASGTATWIQAMPLGDYSHPVYGNISITPERVQRFAANVKNKVRGTDLDIDYDHKSKTEEAAGWVKDAEARSDGLWILVDWTVDAFQKIKNKAYRYFSPEFNDEWEHPKTKVKYQDVLFGGGLTNRPFLKDILPINMSEVFDSVHLSQGGVSMDEVIKSLAKLLGLPEDATAEQVLGAAQVKLATPEGDPEPKDPPAAPADPNAPPADPEKKEEDPQQTPQQIAASELVAKLKELDPAIAKMFSDQNKQLAEVQAALRLSEVNNKVVKLNEHAATKKRIIPPAAQDIVKELLLEAPTQLSDKVYQLVHKLADVGFVELGERGHTRSGSEGDKTAGQKFSELIAEAQGKDKNLSYADAVELVASRDPKLFDEYRTESFAFKD